LVKRRKRRKRRNTKKKLIKQIRRNVRFGEEEFNL